jgi:hypothetical protein
LTPYSVPSGHNLGQSFNWIRSGIKRSLILPSFKIISPEMADFGNFKPLKQQHTHTNLILVEGSSV